MIRALFLEELSLWSWMWQSTLFALIGLAGSFLLRRRPARACQGLFLAMVAAVVVPVMSVSVTHFGLGLLAAQPILHEPRMPYEVVAVAYEAPAVVPPAEIQIDVRPADIQADRIPTEPTPQKAASQSADIPWRSILLYGWMIATLILLGRLSAAFVGGVRLLRRARSQGCEPVQRAADSARTRLGITKDLRIRSGEDVHSPMIWCWSNPPVLLVPGDLDCDVNWIDVICHELAHWRRWDHLTGLLAELAVCILPWNLLLWWARKRIVRLSEQACDDWVVASGRAGADYAQSLLNLSPKEQMAFLPTMIGKEKPMKERIYRIVKEKYGDPRIGARWALAMTVIAATLTVGVAFAQRRPERFDPPDRDEQPAPEQREQQARSELRAELQKRMRRMEAKVAETERRIHGLEESGEGESDEAQGLRADLRDRRKLMAVLEREFQRLGAERGENQARGRGEGVQQRREILRRLDELGHETESALRRLEEQRPGWSDEAVALHRRMRELNEQMREVRRELGRRLAEPERRRPEREDRERPESDRRIQELTRQLEELRMNSQDKERALHELAEQGKAETDDAHTIRRNLEEIHHQMQAVEQELGAIERERAPVREARMRMRREPAPEARMREREELAEKGRLIELELRELGGEHPERAEMLERQLHEIHIRIEQLEREPDRFERPRPHAEELHVRREHLRVRLREIEHVLRELTEQGKGESEEAHNLGRELHVLQEKLEATEHELHSVDRERPLERGRDDLERQVQELRMQVNSVNEQMGEMRELLTRLSEEGGLRERR